MVPFAAVDPGDLAAIISGTATVAIAALTLVTALSGRRAAKAAETSANAADEAARLAQRQLQEAHRPLLIPEDPREEGDETIVPVRNFGIGPAISVYGRARIRDQSWRLQRRRREPGERTKIREPFPLNLISGVPAGGVANLRFNGTGVPTRSFIDIKVTFKDATGRSYTTEAHYDDLRTKGFAHVRVVEGDTARIPVDVRIEQPAPGSPPGSVARISVDRPGSAAIPQEDASEGRTADR